MNSANVKFYWTNQLKVEFSYVIERCSLKIQNILFRIYDKNCILVLINELIKCNLLWINSETQFIKALSRKKLIPTSKTL